MRVGKVTSDFSDFSDKIKEVLASQPAPHSDKNYDKTKCEVKTKSKYLLFV